jgi:hypothetical protein
MGVWPRTYPSDGVAALGIEPGHWAQEDALHFVIFPGHSVGDIEWIVYENDRFAVVAKREGTPADVARDQNPRG